MRNSSIQNMDSGHSVFNRSYTVLQFRDHSSGNCSAFDQFIRLIYSKSCDQRRFILVVSVYPFNIREERKLLSMNRFCDRISCIIRIDIISVVIIIENGTAVDYSEEKATEILSQEEVKAVADVKMGSESATAWGCDLTHGYIDINADYRS